MTMLTVPIIDLTPYREGDHAAKLEVARQVDEACRDIGFLIISGHGVPDAVVEAAYRSSKAFFARPLEEKKRLNRPAPDQVRGYSAVGDEGLSYSLDEPAPPDLKESLSIGPIDVPDEPYFNGPAAGPHFAPNLWPKTPAELRPAWTAYFREMEQLSMSLMRIFALGLGLNETYFDSTGDRHISMFRALRYPNQPEAPHKGQLRAGAHSDYGALTILRQETRPGSLQVLNKSGEWVDVPAIPGTFVVNIGDLMAQWTNDRWVSTMHRVVNPPREHALDSERVSLVYFHQPNYDALVSCLATCQSEANPPKYAPVTSGDHLVSKFVKQTTFGRGVESQAR